MWKNKKKSEYLITPHLPATIPEVLMQSRIRVGKILNALSNTPKNVSALKRKRTNVNTN